MFITDSELSNALTRDAKLVLPFISLAKKRNQMIHYDNRALHVHLRRYHYAWIVWTALAIKLGYITRAVIGWNSVFHQSIEHKARELQLSRYLPNCTMSDHFPNFSVAFFRWLRWNFGTSETANSKRRTKQRFVIISSAVIDVVIKRAGTKWTVQVLKVFTEGCPIHPNRYDLSKAVCKSFYRKSIRG